MKDVTNRDEFRRLKKKYAQAGDKLMLEVLATLELMEAQILALEEFVVGKEKEKEDDRK